MSFEVSARYSIFARPKNSVGFFESTPNSSHKFTNNEYQDTLTTKTMYYLPQLMVPAIFQDSRFIVAIKNPAISDRVYLHSRKFYISSSK